MFLSQYHEDKSRSRKRFGENYIIENKKDTSYYFGVTLVKVLSTYEYMCMYVYIYIYMMI